MVACAETSLGQCDWRSAAVFTEKADTLASSKSLAGARSTAPMRQRIGSLQGQLDAEAQRRLKQSRQGDAKQNYAESLKGYRSIVTDFPSRPCAAEARKALAAAAADPKRKGLLDQIVAAEMEQSIAGLLKRAEGPGANSGSRVERIKALKAPTQATVVAELEKLATQYPSSSQGRRAAADLKTLRADKDYQGAPDKQGGPKKTQSPA